MSPIYRQKHLYTPGSPPKKQKQQAMQRSLHAWVLEFPLELCPASSTRGRQMPPKKIKIISPKIPVTQAGEMLRAEMCLLSLNPKHSCKKVGCGCNSYNASTGAEWGWGTDIQTDPDISLAIISELPVSDTLSRGNKIEINRENYPGSSFGVSMYVRTHTTSMTTVHSPKTESSAQRPLCIMIL